LAGLDRLVDALYVEPLEPELRAINDQAALVIAAYDGQFYRGALVATVTLKDGHTQTEPLLGPVGAVSFTPPPLTTQLHDMEAQLAQTPAGRPHQRPLHGIPNPISTRLQTIRRRIAYEHSHPGLLPAP
jgi:hypothetical protein